jgi:hypothetical protein
MRRLASTKAHKNKPEKFPRRERDAGEPRAAGQADQGGWKGLRRLEFSNF